MTAFGAVVFDLFGTLVYELPRTEWDAWLDTCAATLEADAGVFRDAWEATSIERQTGAMGPIEEILRTIAARAGAWPSEAQVAEALEDRMAMYRKWFEPRPGAAELLAELRSRGLPLALISMCAPDTPALWRSSALAGTVDAEVFSSEVGLRKPGAEIYLLAADRLGVAPTGCLYVGDGSYGELTGAREVGMTPVLILDPEDDDGLRPESERAAWGGRTIGHLSEVSQLLAAGAS